MSDPSETVAQNFGAKLKRARLESGLTQEELAYLARVNRSAISPLELGQHLPRLDTVIKLAGALGVEPCELMADVRWTPPPQEGRRGGEFRKL